jgi:hypothetical protein
LQNRRAKRLKKKSALLGQRPAFPPRVTHTIALWRFCRRASPNGPDAAPLGTVSASPISVSLSSEPKRPRTPSGSKGPIEQRHAFDTPVANDQSVGNEIDSVERERFARRHETSATDFVTQPIARQLVDRRTSPMEALLFVFVDDAGHATFHHIWRPALNQGRSIRKSYRRKWAPKSNRQPSSTSE